MRRVVGRIFFFLSLAVIDPRMLGSGMHASALLFEGHLGYVLRTDTTWYNGD